MCINNIQNLNPIQNSAGRYLLYQHICIVLLTFCIHLLIRIWYTTLHLLSRCTQHTAVCIQLNILWLPDHKVLLNSEVYGVVCAGGKRHIYYITCFFLLFFLGLNISEGSNSSNQPHGTNSSSVAIAILVPFFALIFAGFGFYLYKQR